MKRLAFLIWLALGTPLLAADSPIHWPVQPAPPAPPPAPSPAPLSALAADELFVIQLDSDAVVVASPPGILAVSKKSGPITIHAKFVGSGKLECKDFTSKFVAIASPQGQGPAEIIVVTTDGTTERRLIQVGALPPPPVPPVPPPPADPLTAALQAAYAQETDPHKAAQVAQLAALYENAPALMDGAKGLGTTADVVAWMQNARKIVLPDDNAIVHVRQALQPALQEVLSPSVTLDGPKKTAIAALFKKIAIALEGLK